MNLKRLPRQSLLAAAVCLSVAFAARAADEPNDAPKIKGEKNAGTIVKIEPITGKADNKDAGRVKHLRVTINTAAVWEDYARDQTPDAKVKAVDDSITTKGQPESADTVVQIDIGPDTSMHLRYRLAGDERSLGFASERDAEAASKTGGEPGQPSADDGAKKLAPDDLKVGQFVDFEGKEQDGRTIASRVVVLRSVGGNPQP